MAGRSRQRHPQPRSESGGAPAPDHGEGRAKLGGFRCSRSAAHAPGPTLLPRQEGGPAPRALVPLLRALDQVVSHRTASRWRPGRPARLRPGYPGHHPAQRIPDCLPHPGYPTGEQCLCAARRTRPSQRRNAATGQPPSAMEHGRRRNIGHRPCSGPARPVAKAVPMVLPSRLNSTSFTSPRCPFRSRTPDAGPSTGRAGQGQGPSSGSAGISSPQWFALLCRQTRVAMWSALRSQSRSLGPPTLMRVRLSGVKSSFGR